MSELASQLVRESAKQRVDVPVSWLTMETAAYIALTALALGLRLAALGAYPLAESEALQALAAWGAAQGVTWPAGAYSPLILSLNVPIFLLFGANDFTARLAPALLGSALVPLPYFLRHRLGRSGALVASALLAWSPSTLYFSRFAGGGIGVAFGAMLATIGIVRWLDYREERWLYLGAGGLAVALASDGGGYLFLILAATFICGMALFGPGAQQAEVRAALAAVRSTPGLAGRVAAVFLLTFLAGATVFFFRASDLSQAADLLAEWLAAFITPTGPPVSPPLLLLILYEPLALVLGLAGISAILVRRLDGQAAGTGGLFEAMFLIYWFTAATAIVTLQQGRTAGAVPLITLPLIILASAFLGRLLPGSGERQDRLVEWLLVGVLLTVSTYGYINLAWYSRSGEADRILMAAIACGLCGGVLALFWLWYGMPYALRGGILTLALLLGASSFAAGQRLAYDLQTLPYEPLAASPTAQGVRDALKTLVRTSNHQAGDAHAIDITVEEATGPILRWYLRDFTNANFVSDVGPAPTSQVLVTTDRRELGTEGPYAGEGFTLRTSWVPQELDAVTVMHWLFFRQPNRQPQEEKFVLWLKQ
jgi:uncharacterized protein (TIGR03663 family)